VGAPTKKSSLRKSPRVCPTIPVAICSPVEKSAQRRRREAGLADPGRGLARILEKQNCLRMSQL